MDSTILCMLIWLVAGPFQVLVHEASHCFAVWLHGDAHITAFRPFPFFKHPRSLKGYICIHYHTNPGRRWKAITYIIPLPVALAMAIGYYAVGGLGWTFCIWPIIDIIWWWTGYFTGTYRDDGRKFRHYWKYRGEVGIDDNPENRHSTDKG